MSSNSERCILNAARYILCIQTWKRTIVKYVNVLLNSVLNIIVYSQTRLISYVALYVTKAIYVIMVANIYDKKIISYQ